MLKPILHPPEFLRENIVTEAIVSSLTSLDNFCSLPVAVDYTTQRGKMGEAMAELFENHIRTLQACESCQKQAPDQHHILKYEQIHCSSYCKVCYQSKVVCEQCKLLGQVSYLPSLQFCDSCRDKDVPCFRRVVMIVCSDCETGNKTAFRDLKS